jgi:hypothetical protein
MNAWINPFIMDPIGKGIAIIEIQKNNQKKKEEEEDHVLQSV